MGPLTTLGMPHTSGISETLPAKDESSNSGLSKHRDTALYNKSTLFPSKGEGISTFFFLIIDFIMVKWIGTCQVSQEVFSPKRPTCSPSAGAAFLTSRAGSPSLHMPFFPVGPASKAAREQCLISQLFHGSPRPRLKSGFKRSPIFLLFF